MKTKPIVTIYCLIYILLASSCVLADTVIIRDGELVLDKLDVDTLQTNDLTATDIIYTDTANKRVGIGISNPAVALDVFGQINATADICTEAGGYCLSQIAGLAPVWSTSGSNIYYDAGNVGIGTNAPLGPLDVRDSDGKKRLLVFNNDGANPSDMSVIRTESGGIVTGIALYGTFGRDGWGNLITNKIYYGATTHIFHGGVDDLGGSLGIIPKIGIGTTNPQATLDVNGVIRATQICDETGGHCKILSSGWSYSETDPTITQPSIKDGVSWSELTGIPAGFSDGTDNVGITSETDPTITQPSIKDGIIWSEITGSCPCGGSACWTSRTVNCNPPNYVTCYDDVQLCTPAGWVYTGESSIQRVGSTCFVSGTKVLMADGSLKSIQDVVIGDKVQGKDSINTVIGYERPIVGGRTTYVINGNVEFTGDHPFLSKDGWKVADLEAFNAYPRKLGAEPTRLMVGDILITQNGEVMVETLEARTDRPDQEIVYDLKLDGDETYTANGFIVHNC